MAEKYATKAGNWSDPTVWNGGTLPVAGDDVFANGFAVVIDQDINVGTLRTTAHTLGGGVSGGSFTAGSVTCAIAITNANGLDSGSYNVTNSSYLLTVSGPGTVTLTTPRVKGGASTARHGLAVATGATLIINGNVVGGDSSGVFGIVLNSATLTINGNVTGGVGASSTACGILFNTGSTGVLTVNGNVTGGGGSSSPTTHAIQCNTAGTIIVNGNVTGGLSGSGGTASFGMQIGNDNAVVTVNGNVTAGNAGTSCHGINISGGRLTVIGVVSGGSASGPRGINAAGTTSITVRGTLRMGSATSTSGSPAIESAASVVFRFSGHIYTGATIVGSALNGYLPVIGPLTAIEGEEVYLHLFNDDNFPSGNNGSQRVLTRYGTNLPDMADVREGTAYGEDALLTGTLSVPDPASVMYGVATDDTVGTAMLDQETVLARLTDAIGDQIAGFMG